MKKLILLACVLAATVLGSEAIGGMYVQNTASAGASYLLEQDFEDTVTNFTGEENYDFAFTGAGAPLSGTQSMELGRSGSVGGGAAVSSTFTASELWVYYIFRAQGTAIASDCYPVRIQNSSDTNIFRIYYAANRLLYLKFGDVTGLTTGFTFDLNTTYYIWIRFKPGDGTAEADFWVSTTSTKPGSPTSSRTGQTAVGTMDHMYFSGYSELNCDFIYDDILIDDENIGSQ